MIVDYKTVALIILASCQALAANDECLRVHTSPPCDGHPGKCTRNRDGSAGGFVADTAHVESKSFFGLRRRNVPFIGIRAQVCDLARVSGDAKIEGNAQILMNARVKNRAAVRGNAIVAEYARVYESAEIGGNARIFGNALICQDAWVDGSARVFGNARILGNAYVCESAVIGGDAVFGSGTITEIMTETIRTENRGIELGTGNTQESASISEPMRGKSYNHPILSEGVTTIYAEQNPEKLQTKVRAGVCLEKLKEMKEQIASGLTDVDTCPICQEAMFKMAKIIFTRCDHFYCEKCFKHLREAKCPVCRSDISTENLQVVSESTEDIN